MNAKADNKQHLSGRPSRNAVSVPLLPDPYEAAVVTLARVKRASRLKDRAQAIAKRSGPGKARVASARKLSVILRGIWR